MHSWYNAFAGRNHTTPPKLKVGVEIENFYEYWEFKKSDEFWEWIIIMMFYTYMEGTTFFKGENNNANLQC